MNRAVAGLFVVSSALHAAPVAAEFRPAEDQAYRYVTRQFRNDGGTKRSFTAERRVTFRRLGAGWRAEVVLERTSQTASADIGTMFQAAMAAFVDHPIRFDLDAVGQILAIDDLDAVWARAMDAIDAMAGPRGAARRTNTRTVTAPMRALPPDRRRDIIASVLSPLIDLDAATRQAGTRPVSIPSVSPVGAPIELAGEESVTIDPQGVLAIATSASGTIAPLMAPGTPGAELASPGATASASVHITALRRIDPSSGLVIDSREENRVCTGPAGPNMCISTVTEMTLTLLVL